MTSLESIVLPLSESRALAEKVKLDTALVWVYVKDANGRIVLTVMSRRDADAACLGADCDGQKVICGAPTLSELLDAIRKATGDKDTEFAFGKYRVDEGEIQCGVSADWTDPKNWEADGHAQEFGSTDLLAAYALLLEVAK